MKVWYITDMAEDNYDSIWDKEFFLKEETAQARMDEAIARRLEKHEQDQALRVESWRRRFNGLKAIQAAGIPAPYELAYVPVDPPKGPRFCHNFQLDYLEVQED